MVGILGSTFNRADLEIVEHPLDERYLIARQTLAINRLPSLYSQLDGSLAGCVDLLLRVH